MLTFIGVLTHEPHGDEAQVWLIVRDLNLSNIFSQLHYEGHPCLWYLIVLPFAKTGFPYFTMQLIHWMIAITAVGLFVFKAPINKVLKVLFIFSYYILFEYAINARNYGIVVLCLFAIATCYKSRFSHPYRYAILIVALFSSHILALGAALGLTAIYFLEVYNQQKLKNYILPLSIMLIGAILLILQLGSSASSPVNPFIPIKSYFPSLNINSIWIVLTRIQNAFMPVFSKYDELKVALFFTTFFCLFFILYLNKPYVLIFLIISCGWLVYFFSTLFAGLWRHEGLFLIFIMFSLWIMNYYTDKENFLSRGMPQFLKPFFLKESLQLFLITCLLVNTIFGFSCLRKEYRYSYSGSKEVVSFIKRNHLENNEIACYQSWPAAALSPYLPTTKLWHIDREEYGSFIKLDTILQKYGDSLTEKDILQRTKNKYHSSAFLLLNKPLSESANKECDSKLLFKNDIFIWSADDETFYLYKITFNNKYKLKDSI